MTRRVGYGLLLFFVAATLLWIYRPPVPKPAPLVGEYTNGMEITSSAFAEGGMIPSQYTCDLPSGGKNPPLSWSDVPAGAVSLALIMDDPDVPKALKPDGVFDHWVLYDINPATKGVGEGEQVGTAGANGAGANAYTGPCPPREYEPSTHRYIFVLYALDTTLGLPPGTSKHKVLAAIEGHVLAQAQLIGTYKKKQ